MATFGTDLKVPNEKFNYHAMTMDLRAHTFLFYIRKDQVPVIADHVADGIAFLDEFRSFAKDRLQLEREYAQKLDTLCKKYNSKRQKVAATKSAVTQTIRTEDEWDWTDKSR
jgi:hypothetical protein